MQVAKNLYGKGYHIIFGARNMEKNAEAVKTVTEAHPGSKGSIKYFKLDQASKSSVEDFCDNVKK